MRPFSWKILPLLLLTLLVGGISSSRLTGWVLAEEPVPASATTDEAEVHPAQLADLRADPLAWLGQHVRFTFQYKSTVDAWNPYLTRFGPGDWISFGGWPDEHFTWDQPVFDDPMPRLFARRGGEVARVIDRAASYHRFTVTAVVREVFLDEPWIEVVGIEPLDEFVGQGAILHVGRAHDLRAKGQLELAIQQLGRAQSAPLPDHAIEELERLEQEWRTADEQAQTPRPAAPVR